MKETHKPVIFEELKGVTSDKLAIANFGEAGTGKTRFIITAPAPIGVVPLDRKTRRTIEKSNNGKRILFPKEDYIRHDNPMKLAMMEPDAARDYYRKHVNQIKDAIYTLAERQDVKTIAIDSASQLWEDILFANYGRNQKIMPRDRGSANQEMIDLLNSLQHKHLILTHKAREIWRQDKPTGRYEAVGFPHIDYHVNVIVEHTRDDRPKRGDKEPSTVFNLSVKLCQENAVLHGDEGRNILSDEAITFQMLALMIFEGSDPEDWE